MSREVNLITTRSERRREALEELREILTEKHEDVELILVEGQRDVEAIRNLGAFTSVDVSFHSGKTEQDIAVDLSHKIHDILVLTDFDDKGKSKAKRFSQLLEAEGVNVRRELRRKFGRLMGVLGVKTIESLDDIYVKDLLLKSPIIKQNSIYKKSKKNHI